MTKHGNKRDRSLKNLGITMETDTTTMDRSTDFNGNVSIYNHISDVNKLRTVDI